MVELSSFEVLVPASTSNLGAGFDCFGIALNLYLSVRAIRNQDQNSKCAVETTGEGAGELPQGEENLIFRAMRAVAKKRGLSLPPVRLVVQNEIPLGRGLGSSGAAALAGAMLAGPLCNTRISDEVILECALAIEGHADNLAACFYGGWTVACTGGDGAILALKLKWPEELKLLIVSPEVQISTAEARGALPVTLRYDMAIYNVQRAALFCAAIQERAYDYIWEAMKDRLHQEYRCNMAPGLKAALSVPRMPGLLGVAMSGAGPSVVAVAIDSFDQIGSTIAKCFNDGGLKTTTRLLDVDSTGFRIRELIN